MAVSLYRQDLAASYDARLPSAFGRYKKQLLRLAGVSEGARVLVACCGTGLDFEPILSFVGDRGEIVAVDASPEMLAIAEARVQAKGWRNIRLIEADLARLSERQLPPFDLAVCTLGLSIIPRCMRAYESLRGVVRSGGTLAIGDMQLASGIWSFLNPFIVGGSRRYGGGWNGHGNLELIHRRMMTDLSGVGRRSVWFGSYLMTWGTKP